MSAHFAVCVCVVMSAVFFQPGLQIRILDLSHLNTKLNQHFKTAFLICILSQYDASYQCLHYDKWALGHFKGCGLLTWLTCFGFSPHQNRPDDSILRDFAVRRSGWSFK